MNAVYVRAYPANISAAPSQKESPESLRANAERQETRGRRREMFSSTGINRGKESLFVVKWKDAGRPQ
jgi:hypothetical protein